MKARKRDYNVWELPSRNGPSEAFIRRRFNPDEPHSPQRFEPSKPVREDDVWL